MAGDLLVRLPAPHARGPLRKSLVCAVFQGVAVEECGLKKEHTGVGIARHFGWEKPKAEKGKTVDQVIKGWSKDRQTESGTRGMQGYLPSNVGWRFDDPATDQDKWRPKEHDTFASFYIEEPFTCQVLKAEFLSAKQQEEDE
eukprot:gene27297-16486_t